MGFVSPPTRNPFDYQEKLSPKDRKPTPESRMKGKWDEGSVEKDLPFVEEAIRIIDMSQTSVQFNKSDSVKTGLRHELEQAGWQYNSRATFKANFPLGRKYLVFDYSYKQDIKNSYRLKVATGHGIVSGYKLLKWIEKIGPDFELIDLFTTKKGLLILIMLGIVLGFLIPMLCGLVVDLVI